MSEAADRYTAAVLALLAALLVGQLLIPPIVGLADQSDFDRLWRWFGIESAVTDPEQRYFRYLIREWRIDPSNAHSSGFLSADLLFVAASVQLNALLSKAGTYDIRTLGAVRIAALLFVAFLLMRAAARGGLAMRIVSRDRTADRCRRRRLHRVLQFRIHGTGVASIRIADYRAVHSPCRRPGGPQP